MTFNPCHVCNQSNRETKPCGSKRQFICLECVTSDPERMAIAKLYMEPPRVIVLPMSALLDALNSAVDADPECDCPQCKPSAATMPLN